MYMFIRVVVMPLNVELITSDNRFGRELVLFHWGCSILSNYSRFPFVIDGQTYHTVEQYYEVTKARYFGDYKTLKRMLKADSPSVCRKLARDIKGFDSTQWRSVCDSVMLHGVTEKFLQNADARKHLLRTEKSVIAAANNFDMYWGIGLAIDDENSRDLLKWKGLNKLGVILMYVRQMLKE